MTNTTEQNPIHNDPIEGNLTEMDGKNFLDLKERFNNIIGRSNMRTVLNNPQLDEIVREMLDLINKHKRE